MFAATKNDKLPFVVWECDTNITTGKSVRIVETARTSTYDMAIDLASLLKKQHGTEQKTFVPRHESDKL